MAYLIIEEICKKTGNCLEECPMDAINKDSDSNYSIDPEMCTDCGSCADVCPNGAITGVA